MEKKTLSDDVIQKERLEALRNKDIGYFTGMRSGGVPSVSDRPLDELIIELNMNYARHKERIRQQNLKNG